MTGVDYETRNRVLKRMGEGATLEMVAEELHMSKSTAKRIVDECKGYSEAAKLDRLILQDLNLGKDPLKIIEERNVTIDHVKRIWEDWKSIPFLHLQFEKAMKDYLLKEIYADARKDALLYEQSRQKLQPAGPPVIISNVREYRQYIKEAQKAGSIFQDPQAQRVAEEIERMHRWKRRLRDIDEGREDT